MIKQSGLIPREKPTLDYLNCLPFYRITYISLTLIASCTSHKKTACFQLWRKIFKSCLNICRYKISRYKTSMKRRQNKRSAVTKVATKNVESDNIKLYARGYLTRRLEHGLYIPKKRRHDFIISCREIETLPRVIIPFKRIRPQ